MSWSLPEVRRHGRPVWLAFLTVLLAAAPVASALAEETDESLAPALVREAAEYGWRQWVRQRMYDPADEERFGLQFDETWQAAPAELPVVVLVHGFNSTPGRNFGVLGLVREAGYPCAGFAYPNDHTLTESAVRLSRELKTLASEYPQRQVVLVTHSMGGLVARACIEDPQLAPGNVQRLVQIAPPSQGTLLAHFAVATDLWEHWLGRDEGGAWTRWRDSIIDGLGEAADDLIPDSPFLTELNARQRNANVQYAILLGTAASVSEDEMNWLRTAVSATSGRIPGLRRVSNRLHGMLEDMEELVDGKGDGVVAVKRGRLEGVDDIAVLPFNHITCTAADTEDGLAVQQAVLARLQ